VDVIFGGANKTPIDGIGRKLNFSTITTPLRFDFQLKWDATLLN
jgi:hypothetical protein